MIIASNKPREKGTGAQGTCAHSHMNSEAWRRRRSGRG